MSLAGGKRDSAKGGVREMPSMSRIQRLMADSKCMGPDVRTDRGLEKLCQLQLTARREGLSITTGKNWILPTA